MISEKQRAQPKNQENEILVTVVIATFNGSEYIERCLESFTNQSLKEKLYEIIVVNNNSTDQTSRIVEDYVRKYDNFQLLDEEKPGVSHARNKGISLARGKYVCFIDDDAYADQNWVEKIVNAFEKTTPEPAVVGGRILPYYNSEKPSWFNDTFEVRSKGNQARFLPKDKRGFPESNYSVRKAIIEEVGAFSTDFGPKGKLMGFGEGSELSRRIEKKYPYFWYDPDIIVYHLVRKRNMSVKYILARKYKTAFLYQAFRTPSAGFLKNLFTFSTCFIRVVYRAVLSIVFVRWFSKKAVTDWLFHIIDLVNNTARMVFIIKYYAGMRRSPDYQQFHSKIARG